MNCYSNEERIFMVKTFYSGVSLRRVRDLFEFHTRPIPSVSTIHKFVQKFERCANISLESEARGGK
jgi:transposase